LNATDFLTGEITEIPPEGSLLPNTYAFNRDATRQSVLDRMIAAQEAASMPTSGNGASAMIAD
jgi:UPF0755 protein